MLILMFFFMHMGREVGLYAPRQRFESAFKTSSICHFD